MYKFIKKEELVNKIDSHLKDIDYNKRMELIEFIDNPYQRMMILGGYFGRGFKIVKVLEEGNIARFYFEQYPEYESIYTFAWVSDVNKELLNIRLEYDI